MPIELSKSSRARTTNLSTETSRYSKQLRRGNGIPPVTMASSVEAAVTGAETADVGPTGNWNSLRDKVMVSGGSYGMDAGISVKADWREGELQQEQKKEQERMEPLPAPAPPPSLLFSGAESDGYPFSPASHEADSGVPDGHHGGLRTVATRWPIIVDADAPDSGGAQETRVLKTVSLGPEQEKRAGLFVRVASGQEGTKSGSIGRSFGDIAVGKGVSRDFEGGGWGGKGFHDGNTGVSNPGEVHGGDGHRVSPTGSKRDQDASASLSLLVTAEDESAAVAKGFDLATGLLQSSYDAVAGREGGFEGSSSFSKSKAAIGHSNHNHKLLPETVDQRRFFQEWRADHYRGFHSLQGRKLHWEREMFWLDLSQEAQRDARSSLSTTLGLGNGEGGLDGGGGQEVAANAPRALIVAEARSPSSVLSTSAKEAAVEQVTSPWVSSDRDGVFLRRRGAESSVPGSAVGLGDYFSDEEVERFSYGKWRRPRLRKRVYQGEEDRVEVESKSPPPMGHLGVDSTGRRFKVLAAEIQKDDGVDGEGLNERRRVRNALQGGETYVLGDKGVPEEMLPCAVVDGRVAGIGIEGKIEGGVGGGIVRNDGTEAGGGIREEVRKEIGIEISGRGRWSRRNLVEYPSEFPGGVELTCNLDVQDGVSMDGPIIREPGEVGRVSIVRFLDLFVFGGGYISQILMHIYLSLK